MDIMDHLQWIVNTLSKFKHEFIWDCAGKAFSSFDYLYYGTHIPQSREILEQIFKINISDDNAILGFLKIQLDREISSMPRSFFLGNVASSNKLKTQASAEIDHNLVAKNMQMCKTQWKITPYFFGTNNY